LQAKISAFFCNNAQWSALSKKWVIRQPVSLAYKTGVRFFEFYGRGKKFQKMFSPKLAVASLHNGLHGMDAETNRPMGCRCGRI